MTEPHIPGPREQSIPSAENLFKALFLLAALLASFSAIVAITRAIDTALPSAWYGVALKFVCIAAITVWNCLLLTGMGVLAHDAVHRVLFRTPFWNEFCGGLLSALTFLPFNANRQFHLTHHSYAHQPGLDPENEMHDHGFVRAATVGSVLALTIQYRILFQTLRKTGEPRHVVRAARDLLALAAAGLFYFALIPALGLPPSLTVVPMLIALLPVYAWRALSDHYGVPPAERAALRDDALYAEAESERRDEDARRLEVSGWVVLTSPWLEWLWSHVNYHEVHHKYPWLSHVHLKAAFAATREREPYLVARGYWRSLLNIAGSRYYESRDRVRPFLTTPGW